MKGNTVYKRTRNRFLDLMAEQPIGARLGPETELAGQLEVSRTTLRSVLASMTEDGILAADGSRRLVARHPVAADYFPEIQTETVGEIVERQFLQWVLQGDFRSGQLINCAELARKFNTSTTAIREYLTHFNHFGLLERRPNSAWVFKGLTEDFAREICEIREMFEMRSALRFIDLDAEAPQWAELSEIEAEHHRLLADIDARFGEFSQLDDRFHRMIHEASRNRFVLDFYGVISMIFHYHYEWNKADEKQRNEVALHEHLAYIAALRARDRARVEETCAIHLRSARTTLLRSIRPVAAEA